MSYTHARYNIYVEGEYKEDISIFTYRSLELAKINSMNYSICRAESESGDYWIYFYRGKRVNVQIHSNT